MLTMENPTQLDSIMINKKKKIDISNQWIHTYKLKTWTTKAEEKKKSDYKILTKQYIAENASKRSCLWFNDVRFEFV